MKDELAWLLNWFEARGKLPDKAINELVKANYFDLGLIDSFGIIELIQETEAHFGVQFVEENFQDRRFSTLEGLSAVIAEIRARANAN